MITCRSSIISPRMSLLISHFLQFKSYNANWIPVLTVKDTYYLSISELLNNLGSQVYRGACVVPLHVLTELFPLIILRANGSVQLGELIKWIGLMKRLLRRLSRPCKSVKTQCTLPSPKVGMLGLHRNK